MQNTNRGKDFQGNVLVGNGWVGVQRVREFIKSTPPQHTIQPTNQPPPWSVK